MTEYYITEIGIAKCCAYFQMQPYNCSKRSKRVDGEMYRCNWRCSFQMEMMMSTKLSVHSILHLMIWTKIWCVNQNCQLVSDQLTCLIDENIWLKCFIHIVCLSAMSEYSQVEAASLTSLNCWIQEEEMVNYFKKFHLSLNCCFSCYVIDICPVKVLQNKNVISMSRVPMWVCVLCYCTVHPDSLCFDLVLLNLE